MTKPEVATRWGLVVESDEIYSERTKKWYEVAGSVSVKGTDTVKIFVKGVPKAFERNAHDPVTIRRGGTGQAVDVLQLVFSAQTMPEVKE